jgi:hypothetical protein
MHSVKYSGVAYSGIQNNVAYMTSDLNFWTLEFSLFEMLMVPLCDETMTSAGNNTSDCPGNGKYNYSVDYKLPNSGSDSASWLASGWEGTGFIRMYAEPDESMMIGECLLTLQTFVTPDPTTKWYQVTPSAAVLSGIVLGISSVLMLGCLYCYCCCRRRSETKMRDKISPEHSLESTFMRMEDEKATTYGMNSSKSVGANIILNQHPSSNKSVVSELGGGRVPIM